MHKILTPSRNLQTIPIHIQNMGKMSSPAESPLRRELFRYSHKNTCRVQMRFFSLLGGLYHLRLRKTRVQAEKTVPFISHFSPSPSIIHLKNAKTIQKRGIDVLCEAFQKKTCSALSLLLNCPQESDFFRGILHYLPPEILSLQRDVPSQETVRGSLRQIITRSPGEEIIIEAFFPRSDPHDSWVQPPLLQDIRLSKRLSYQGFPFPSERVGWTLSSFCLPDLPTRFTDYPLIQGIREKQWQAKQSAQEKTDVRSWVEANHLLRRQIFDLDPVKWLKYYQNLLEAFLYCVDISKNHFFQYRSILKHFLAWVANAPSPFTILTHVHRRQLSLFVETPYQLLEHQLVAIRSPLPKTPHAKCEAARVLLRKIVSEAEQTIDYTHPLGAYLGLVGPKMAKGCENLLLQNLHEKFHLLPPPLSLGERRLQICALQHLLTFLEALNTRSLSPSSIEYQMEREIEEDLHVLTGTKVHHLLAWGGVQELEDYFLHRQQTTVFSHRDHLH